MLGVLLALALLALVPVLFVACLVAVLLAGPVVAFCVVTVRRAVWLDGTVLVGQGHPHPSGRPGATSTR